ncbi:iron only hydrogenase large subunit, C-terminal domain containing protein [Nitzschia inconspicua]|uniref:Iron only hydrogenase large subunit, C-terminal domain containing protein n=1 Tax=Nitzschia inconspicua TaxID=303405 RepID=A0A9K3PMY2_9STRA|nr:iron only hydrogenase large subunit, C-terminal domain containing protein [Nitzschia inconspicua]
MADCLACSGCVTTAETVLMEQQHSLRTLKECLRSTPDGGPLIGRVITLSPNSWAELCRYWQLNDTEDQYFYYARFTTLLCQILSAHVVVDGNVPLQWTWMGEAEEFCQAYKRSKKENGKKADLSKLFPSIAIDSTKTQIYQSDGTTKIEKSVTGEHHTPFMPLISGSCPALVCLVEKTLTALVPHLSQVISPMSMVGMVLKTHSIHHH